MPRWSAYFFAPALSALVLTVSGLAVGQSSAPMVVQTKPANTSADNSKPTGAAEQEPSAPKLKPADLEKRPQLNEGTKMQLIQVIHSEFVHVRKYFPLGDKSIIIGADGDIKPGDARLYQRAQTYGAAAKIGDKVQITNILFHEKSIYVEINGGPKKKSKWYNHIQLSMGGAGNGGDPNQAQPTGAAMTLEFKQHVPEMTGAEMKLLLGPVLDFSVKTAAEVYVDTLPPKIKAAIKSHEVLVGMNRDMVIMAKERTQRKMREKDDNGEEYEEWLYGMPPQDTTFVRFKGDEVTQVKIVKVVGPSIVKTEKEVDVKDGVATLSALKASDNPEDLKNQPPAAEQPAHRPTLRRPDEQPDPALVIRIPSSSSQTGQHPEEPEWGKNGKQPQSGQQPEDNQQQPPPEPKPPR